MTHNSFSGPISRKFQWKYASFTIIFLHVRNKYSPDPEFCIFLGLGTNFVCYRYKRHLKMLCFTVKPQIFSPGRYIFLYMPKSFWIATTVPMIDPKKIKGRWSICLLCLPFAVPAINIRRCILSGSFSERSSFHAYPNTNFSRISATPSSSLVCAVM